MPRIIVILVLTSAFVITVYSENILKCYMCTSLSNEGCGSNFTTKLQSKECTHNNIMDWQRSIEQHNNLSKITQLFEVDERELHYGASQNMACAKLILNYAKQDVVIRMCQLAKTEYIDSCKVMETKSIGHLDTKMKHCELCFKDTCNSTMFLSSEIFYIFFSFFCTLAAFYRWA